METRLKYGWKPELPDIKDHRLRYAPGAAAGLPRKFSLRDKMPPVRHQLSLGACTAFAVSGIVAYRELGACRELDPSPLFLYFNTRKYFEHTTDVDSGASIRNAVKALTEYGVSREACWPYDVARFRDTPPSSCYAEAVKWKAVESHRVEQTLADLKLSLFHDNPVAFGFTAYSMFESPVTAATGIVNLPGPNEVVLGGHAVVLAGWDDETSRFLVRNSFGGGWGMGGYFTIPYGYVLNRDLADDFWCFNTVP